MPTATDALEQRVALLESELARAREEIDCVDDWANGIMAALLHVVPRLLKKHPDLAASAMTTWERGETHHEQAVRGEPTDMPANWYEAQAVLARVCRCCGVPSPSGRAAQSTLPWFPADDGGNGQP